MGTTFELHDRAGVERIDPIRQGIAAWRAHFPDFRVIGDADIEPLIVRHFPRYLEAYRRIQIPSCRANLARLLALHAWGGLYVDCHCGLRDPHYTRRLLDSLDAFELIAFDKHRASADWHVTNSFMLAAAVRAAGAIAYRVGAIPDDPRVFRETLGEQLVRADLVVTSGGVSEGEIEKRMAARNLVRRIVTAEEIASVVTFLASPRAIAINGDAIPAGGGTPGSIFY